MRIVQVSDLHLSPTHGFFVDNWRNTTPKIDALNPDLVVITGDLCINGPDDEREIAFARSELNRLTSRWRAVPGNHDVGDEPPGQDVQQLVDDVRIKQWREHFGQDWWVEDVGGWRVIGLDAQLFGSGISDDARQEEWLTERLGEVDAPTAIFMHKPLFVDGVADPASPACITPAPRARLIDMFGRGQVRLVASGHLHCYRQQSFQDIDLIWAPSVSFLSGASDGEDRSHGRGDAVHAHGIAIYDCEPGGSWSHRFEPLPDLTHFRLSEIKQGRYRFLRDMPPVPPAEAA